MEKTKYVQDDIKLMNFVIGMFTDLANMNREYHNTKDNEGDNYYNTFNDVETAAHFTDLMTLIFGRQDLDLAAEIFAGSLIRKNRKPSFWIKDPILRKQAEKLERIP